MSGISPTKRQIIYSETSGQCVYCGQPISLKQLSVDHIIPRSVGGSDNLENLVCSCINCNGKKDNMPLAEFINMMPQGKQAKYRHRVEALLFGGIINDEKAKRLLGIVYSERHCYKIEIRICKYSLGGFFSIMKKKKNKKTKP